MKFLIGLTIALFLVITPLGADAAVRVNGYTTKRGTYVAPSYRSSPNSYKSDNYSSKGNYNPYSGRTGTKTYYGR